MVENRESANLKVRKMTENDLAGINEVDNSLRGKQRVTTWPFSFDTYWRVYEPELCYVAELDGKIAGFIAGVIEEEERSKFLVGHLRTSDIPSSDSPKVGWIEMMGVDSDHWGKGTGLALLDAFTEECRKNGASIRTVVREDDDRLKEFFGKRGFKRSDYISYNKEVS
ncbi:GNAT family N-acetyltransferase [Chloroflexota bacterium]